MILFNVDLDNTLIYSYKKDIGEDKRCVEIYQEREISFMTSKSLQLLQTLPKQVYFVPTTTRTREQYERIQFNIPTPKYALVCNGGLLLVDGVSDEAWYQESALSIRNCIEELQTAIQLLELDSNRCFEIRWIEELFIFTKSNDTEKTIQYLSSKLNTELLDIFSVGIKVYVIPKVLNKGNAVLRLKEKLGIENVIVAGDSEFDLSMLAVGDTAFAPEQLWLKYKDDEDKRKILDSCKVIMSSDKLFSDEVLNYVHEI